jgi:2-keto-myo-inositol isomerase
MLMRSYHLEPVSICPFLNMFYCSGHQRKANLNIFKQLLDVANTVGCKLCIVCPEEIHAIEPSQITEEASKILRSLGNMAEEFGVEVGFEFRGIETTFVPNLRSSVDLINEVDHDSVGLVIDTAHFFTSGSSLADLEALDIRKLLLLQVEDLKPSATGKIDVDRDRVYPGDGIVPLREILLIAKNMGYDGFISFETFHTYWNDDPYTVACKALESYKALLSQL